MFTIKTYINRSAIHGVGVFAAADVKKGETVWRYCPDFDRLISAQNMSALPESAQIHIKKHAFGWSGQYCLEGDYGQFLNHSNDPNMRHAGEHEMVASRDIRKGEEITCDYYKTDEYADEKLSGNVPKYFSGLEKS